MDHQLASELSWSQYVHYLYLKPFRIILKNSSILSVNHTFKTYSTLSTSLHDIFKLKCCHKWV